MDQVEINQSVELSWRHFYQSGTLPRELTNAELYAVLPQTINNMVLQLTTHIAGERVHEIRYPLNWWQSFRERWFPKFWLKLYPVEYRHWKVDVLYPKVERGNLLALYQNYGSAGYPHWEDEKKIFVGKRGWVPVWLWSLLSVPEED